LGSRVSGLEVITDRQKDVTTDRQKDVTAVTSAPPVCVEGVGNCMEYLTSLYVTAVTLPPLRLRPRYV